jgi:hypothetical protein
MYASEQFEIQRADTDDWFDAIIDTDTKLFVDPFLIFKEREGFWSDGHAIMMAHFNACFSLIVNSIGNVDSLAYKKAVALLTFREPKEMCLGYTSRGSRGSGGGPQYAATIAEAIGDAIARGLVSLRHFVELGILNEGIGPDRISDLACTILKPKFIAYTQEIAASRVQLGCASIYG